MNRTEAGKLAKKFGHTFENMVAEHLRNLYNTNFIVEGQSGTKVDIRSEDNLQRYSLKKTFKDTQVGLISQNNFIEAANIQDPLVIKFIREFFGGDEYSEYARHRKNKSQIDPKLVEHFENYLNSNTEEILKIAVTEGSAKQKDNVNYILFASVANDVNSLYKIDTEKMIEYFKEHGRWEVNNTTVHFNVAGTKSKPMNIQMFGSGRKFSSGYHSLQFRIACGKIPEQCVVPVQAA